MVDLEKNVRSVVTRSSEETIEFGRSLAGELRPPLVLLLIGDLGAGKTTLTKGIASGLGAASEQDVTSPTFTLVHEYNGRRTNGGVTKAGQSVYHVDLYRIESARELETLGLEDMIADPRSIVIIEWGEKLGASFRNPWPGSGLIEIRITSTSDSERKFEIVTTQNAARS